MSGSACGPKCGLHLVRFARIEGFEDDTPDFSDLLLRYKTGKCQASTARDNVCARVPLCNEDVQATQRAGHGDLFDSELFLTGVCPAHAEAILSRAVEGRACTGEQCAPLQGVQRALPRVGRVMAGTRIYCIECYEERCEALGIEPEEYSDEDDYW